MAPSENDVFLMHLLAASGGPFNYRAACKLEGKEENTNNANALQKRFKKLVEGHGFQLVKGTIVFDKGDTGQDEDDGGAENDKPTPAKKRGRGRPVKKESAEDKPTKKQKVRTMPKVTENNVKQEAGDVDQEDVDELNESMADAESAGGI
ncbi:MAG: hypothetical protein Q9227_008835 [Pyrenula ochraceoflavens]